MSKETARQKFIRLLAGEFVVIDTETSGLEVYDQPVSISVIDHHGHTLFDSLIKPTVRVSDGARAVHGISDVMLVNEPSMADVYNGLYWTLREQTIISYNASFDRRMLRQACDAHKLGDVTKPSQWECAMTIYAEYFGQFNHWRGSYTWQSLEKACRQQGVPYEDGHTALGDCLATLALMRRVANG